MSPGSRRVRRGDCVRDGFSWKRRPTSSRRAGQDALLASFPLFTEWQKHSVLLRECDSNRTAGASCEGLAAQSTANNRSRNRRPISGSMNATGANLFTAPTERRKQGDLKSPRPAVSITSGRLCALNRAFSCRLYLFTVTLDGLWDASSLSVPKEPEKDLEIHLWRRCRRLI